MAAEKIVRWGREIANPVFIDFVSAHKIKLVISLPPMRMESRSLRASVGIISLELAV